MRVKVLIFAAAGLLLIASTSPAPAPYYLAINYATRQCGEYWPGDEYVHYVLPAGWTTYEYDYSLRSVSVETPSGTCSVPKPLTPSSFAEVCCTQFSYTYVAGNIGNPDAGIIVERILPIIVYTFVFLSLALLVTVIVQSWYEKRNQ